MAQFISELLIEGFIGIPARILTWATQSTTHTIAVCIGLLLILLIIGAIIKTIKN